MLSIFAPDNHNYEDGEQPVVTNNANQVCLKRFL